MKIYANSNFKLIRVMNGLTIKSLADRVGMTDQALGQIERGRNGISPANAKAILDELKVGFDDLFQFVERKKK